jgi:bla regulator protein BlaR1
MRFIPTTSPVQRSWIRACAVAFTASSIAFIIGGGVALAQTSQQSKQPRPFEVAAIKPNHSGSGSTTGQTVHGRLTVTNETVRSLILRAFQLMDSQVSGGPDWINTERYDISAKTDDASISDDQLWLSLQPLLIDRFHLRFHRTTKDAPLYSLVVSKPKQALVPHSGPDEPSLKSSMNSSSGKIEASNVTMARLAAVLTPIAGRSVIDNTHLAGGFDFKLEWARESQEGSVLENVEQRMGISSPRLTDAVQDQLGLKLQPARGPMEIVVIDSVDRPTPN